jgi:hypothetical protein
VRAASKKYRWPPAYIPCATITSAPAAAAACLRNSGDVRKLADVPGLELWHEFRWVQPHHRRHDGPGGGQRRFALRPEIRWGGVAGIGRYFQTPLRQEFTYICLMRWISLGGGSGIYKLSRNAPFEPSRNFATHSRIACVRQKRAARAARRWQRLLTATEDTRSP